MRAPLLLAVVAAAALLVAATVLDDPPAAEAAPAAPVARADDVASLDAILAAIYDVISGPAEHPRDWDRFASLFHPSARLMAVRPDGEGAGTLMVMTPDEYRSTSGSWLDRNAFYEQELTRTVARFGHIAHVFSTYQYAPERDATEPSARGINSFQLLWDEERWWVVSILWDNESPEQVLPDRYLPAR